MGHQQQLLVYLITSLTGIAAIRAIVKLVPTGELTRINAVEFEFIPASYSAQNIYSTPCISCDHTQEWIMPEQHYVCATDKNTPREVRMSLGRSIGLKCNHQPDTVEDRQAARCPSFA